MSYSASFEGGLNTVTRVFPPGATGTSGNIVGIMPKNGKIVRVRVHGTVAETLSDVRISTRFVDGSNGPAITDTTFDVNFASVNAAFTGVDLPLTTDQAALGLKARQAMTLVIGTGTAIGDLAVVIQFEPRP